MRKDNLKDILFALVMCIIAAAALSGAVALFKPQQELNVRVDMKLNILKALSIAVAEDPTSKDIESLYASSVAEMVVKKSGEVVDGMKPTQIKDGDTELLPVYQSKKGDEVIAYCIPVSGKGLWSTIYGYLALEPDLNTVKGITFYKHGETPGLGGEVEMPWFQDNFKGKKILDEKGELVSIEVKKGHVVENDPKAIHQVDGISGATMTGKGVNEFLKANLESYKSYFAKERGNG